MSGSGYLNSTWMGTRPSLFGGGGGAKRLDAEEVLEHGDDLGVFFIEGNVFCPSPPPPSTVLVAHNVAGSEEGRCGDGDGAQGLVDLVSVVVHKIRKKEYAVVGMGHEVR